MKPQNGSKGGRGQALGLRLASVSLAAVLVFTGCSRLGNDPDPTASSTTNNQATPPAGEPAADAAVLSLARALISGDLSRVSFIGDPATAAKAATADYTQIMAGMDGLRPTSVTPRPIVYRGNGVATVELDQKWTIGQQVWGFTSTASLNLVGQAWAVAWNPQIVHSDLSPTTRLRHTRSVPTRAPIIDRDGKAVMEVQDLQQIGVDKANLPKAKWASSARQLATLLKIDAPAYEKRVAQSGEKAFVGATTVSGHQVPQKALEIDGVITVAVKGVKPTSPGFAQSILGSVGEAGAAQATASKNVIQAGDLVGTTGLQKRYDAHLRGTPGHEIVKVRRKNAPSPGPSEEPHVDVTLYSQDSINGKPVQLSLDTRLQQKAERVLAGVKPVASMVVINTATGEVVAAANSPASNANPDATFGRYAPGSTFKVVTALAMIRQGMSSQTMVNCPATITVNGRVFKNYTDYPPAKVGRISLSDALAHSCNTAFIGQAASLPKGALQDAAASLGVGVDFEAGFPVFYGSVPETTDPVVAAANTIGQGQVQTSPLAMAGVAASVGAGRTVVPWLVRGYQPKPQAAPLTPQEVNQLRTMMQATVKIGSGRSLDGLVTGAKTGTAEYGNANPPRTHAWMITYHGTMAIAVMVADGQSGSQTAAPLVKAFLG